MISYEDAQARLATWAVPLEPITASLREGLDLVLAEDISATSPLPPFDYSAMDGYAVRASDVVAGRPMRVDGEVRAGGSPAIVRADGALRIFTGAPIPEGADAVIMQERATREGVVVRFDTAPNVGDHIRRAGEDAVIGTRLLERGTLLGPGQLSLLAALDRASFAAVRRPRVVVMPTGDELREPGSVARPGSIPESNGVAIRAMAERAGAVAEVVRGVGDRRSEVRDALRTALEHADMLVTIGGVSVGDHDVVRDALSDVGCTLDVCKVAIRPGKPISFGSDGRAFVLGLPGNPASAMVTFGLFGVPVIRAMRGLVAWRHTPVQMPITHDLAHTEGRRSFLRAQVEAGRVTTLPNQASGAISVVAQANALVSLPATCTGVRGGDEVEVYPFRGLGL